MKILFIISSLGSGGAERVLSTLANYWSDKNRWEIVILTVFSNQFYPIDKEIKKICLEDKKIKRFKPFLSIYHIRRYIKEENPDIIISFMTQVSVYTIISSIGLKIPVIISERTPFDVLKDKKKRVVRNIVYPFADGMVLLSNRDYDNYKMVKNKKVIFNPINIASFKEVSFDKKKRQIIAVGRLIKLKGFDLLIKALSQIDLANWHCIILGEGEERENLTNLIKAKGLEDKVFLLGRKDNIYNYYKYASIFVLSSRHEGFPNALVEAMGHGCASVAFDCQTGPAEIIENKKNGYLVKAEDINELSKKIAYLIKEENIRKEFFQEALKIKTRLDIKKISQEWEEFIKDLL